VSRRVPRLLAQSCAFGLALAAASAAHAQGVHVLAVTGLSGEPVYRLLFESAASTLVDSARARWHVPDSSVIVLAEDMKSTRLRATGRATREEIAKSFLALWRRVAPNDVVLVFLRASGDGWERATCATGATPELAAPAAATVQRLATLNETNPIAVAVDGQAFEVDMVRSERQWFARVQHRLHDPRKNS